MSCCVSSCKRPRCSISGSHTFPKCEQQRTKWLDIIGVNVSSYRSWFIICCHHFDDSDYERDLRAELTGIYIFVECSVDCEGNDISAMHSYDADFRP
jgi:THAP domain